LTKRERESVVSFLNRPFDTLHVFLFSIFIFFCVGKTNQLLFFFLGGDEIDDKGDLCGNTSHMDRSCFTCCCTSSSNFCAPENYALEDESKQRRLRSEIERRRRDVSREREHASGGSGGNDVETATAAGGGAGRRPLQGGRGMGWPAAQTPMGMAPTRDHGATTLVVSPSATPGRVTSYVSNPMGEAKTSSGDGDVEMMEEGGGSGGSGGEGGGGEGKKEEEEESSIVMVAAAGLGKATVVVGRGLWSIASWGASKVFNTGEEEEEVEEEEKKGE